MKQSRMVQRYDDLMGRAGSLPFGRSMSFDINDYVVDQALQGLFYVIAQEEKDIRTNPAARVTELLRGVFGSTG